MKIIWAGPKDGSHSNPSKPHIGVFPLKWHSHRFLSSFETSFWSYEFHLSQGNAFAFTKDLTGPGTAPAGPKPLLILGTISFCMFAMTDSSMAAQVDKHLSDKDQYYRMLCRTSRHPNCTWGIWNSLSRHLFHWQTQTGAWKVLYLNSVQFISCKL